MVWDNGHRAAVGGAVSWAQGRLVARPVERWRGGQLLVLLRSKGVPVPIPLIEASVLCTIESLEGVLTL